MPEIKISCCPVPMSSVDHVVPARGEAIADPYRHNSIQFQNGVPLGA
jgi:hypothetical protein